MTSKGIIFVSITLNLNIHPNAQSVLVEQNAPNSKPLLNTANGTIKQLTTFLMADYWETDATAKRECKKTLQELDIIPLLSRGDSHEQGDSCNPWPPLKGKSPPLSALCGRAHDRLHGGARNAGSAGGLRLGRVSLQAIMVPPRRRGHTSLLARPSCTKSWVGSYRRW